MGLFSNIRNSIEGAIPIVGPMIQGGRQAGAQNDLMNQINSQMNPLFQPQRQGFQQQLNQLMTPEGANSFLQNDPLVKSGTQYLQNQGSANFAKSGNLPLEAINQNAAITQLMSGEYNNRVNQLSGLGGYNAQIPGYLPSTSGTIGQQGINSLFGGQSQTGGQLMNFFSGGGGQGLSNMFGGFLGNMFGGGSGGGGASMASLGEAAGGIF